MSAILQLYQATSEAQIIMNPIGLVNPQYTSYEKWQIQTRDSKNRSESHDQ